MPTVDQSIKCGSCGANIQGADAQGTCSACGASIEESLRRVGVDPVLMNVAEDVICLRCGYNLRSIPINSLCPECGEAVVTSLRGDDLRSADRAWLQRVRSGITLIIISLLAGIGIYLLVIVAMMVTGFTAAAQVPSAAMNVVSTIGWFVLWILFCVGLFKSTASDPSPAAANFSNRYRNWARISALLPLALMPVTGYWAWQTGSNPNAPPSGALLTTIMITAGITFILYGVCAICLIVCIRRLFHRARRIGNRRLATVQIVLLACGTFLASAVTIFYSILIPSMAATVPRMTPAATAPLPGAKVITPAPDIVIEDYTSVDSSSITPEGTTTSTAPAALPPAPPVLPPGFRTMMKWMWLIMVINCSGGLLAVSCFIIGTMLLFRSRRLLSEVLSLTGGV